MNVKVWYKINDDSCYNEYKLVVHYKYKVSPTKYRRGCFVGLKRHDGVRVYETIDEFYERVVDYMSSKQSEVQKKVTNLVLKETRENDMKYLAHKLAKKGFIFTIKERI